MKLGKKPGIVRRPIEYVLLLVAVLLIVVLLIIVWATRRDDTPVNRTSIPARVEVSDGSQEEIGRIAGEELDQEKALVGTYDDKEMEAASADAAADNIGGVYDEAEY